MCVRKNTNYIGGHFVTSLSSVMWKSVSVSINMVKQRILALSSFCTGYEASYLYWLWLGQQETNILNSQLPHSFYWKAPYIQVGFCIWNLKMLVTHAAVLFSNFLGF